MKTLIHSLMTSVLLFISIGCGKNERQKGMNMTNDAPSQTVHYDKNYSCSEVKKIASEVLAISADSIKLDSKLVDLGLSKSVDDIRYMELLMHVESRFELEISDNQAEKFKTIGELCEYIEEQTR
jgi:acyl carrier protein